MAVCIPFRAMRFTERAGAPDETVCPPYDIISEEQRNGFLKKNEHNVIRLELPKGENPYAAAAETQNGWLKDGILALDEKPGVYVYEIEYDNDGERKTVNGIICRVKLEEFSKGIILPHEETLTKAKEDRLNLMKATGSNFSQVYSLYNDEQGETASLIDGFTEQHSPESELCDADGLVHRVWIIDDEKLASEITGQFIDRKLYIADGHHRYETAINYRNYMREQCGAKAGDACDYIMMMLVSISHPGLTVLPTHRVVRGLDGYDTADLLDRCAADFDIQRNVPHRMVRGLLDFAYAEKKTAFAVCSAEGYHILTFRGGEVPEEFCDASPALRGLDVSILHTMVLDRILGIDKANMAAQKNLTYTRIAAEAENAVKSGEAQCAFIMNPTRVSEIRDVAAAGEKMPQKSTYFFPKLITGMVMNKITEY